MKKNWLLIAGVALLAVAAVLMVNSKTNPPPPVTTTTQTATRTTPAPPQHDHSTMAKTMPAHFAVPPSKSSLGPTLDPASFTGITRDAYHAAREIPVTLAQLPCYCHCDQGFGHKSLYSCFQDDHASHCDVCVREALLALKLEKEQKMSPAQIRDTIVAQYSQ
ncbi:MAG TPA: CYCXC family (seleno)protein [Pyrinomonadaceae bacterium]|nr:CYCXC family (seleno)protein [Pyrinomonadaceae bacterium]